MSVRRKITTKPLESTVHRQICDYIRIQYPNALFVSDMSGNAQTYVQAAMAKMLRSTAGIPDLFVAVPKGKYHGLWLEIKREGSPIYLKDGSLSKERHVQEQATVLQKLLYNGYQANFAVGFQSAKDQIDTYMNLKP